MKFITLERQRKKILGAVPKRFTILTLTFECQADTITTDLKI